MLMTPNDWYSRIHWSQNEFIDTLSDDALVSLTTHSRPWAPNVPIWEMYVAPDLSIEKKTLKH
jgi:hypothetical protein